MSLVPRRVLYMFWRELARQVGLASFTYPNEFAGRQSYSLFGHFGITIGPRRPIRSRPVDSFGNNRMKAEKQEDCPAISPKSYVGILVIWTNGICMVFVCDVSCAFCAACNFRTFQTVHLHSNVIVTQTKSMSTILRSRRTIEQQTKT